MGRNMVFRIMHFEWVRFNIEISKVTGPKFTGLVSPNAGEIAIDEIKIRFWISLSISEIFAAELRSRPKSGQILHVFGPWNFFWKKPPEILDWHYKIVPSTDHRAKFRAGRPTHLWDLTLQKINIWAKTWVLPKTIVFGRTNKRYSGIYTHDSLVA